MIFSECTESWTRPSGWTGPDPVVYRSFDNLDCLTLMEGEQQPIIIIFPVFTCVGKVLYDFKTILILNNNNNIFRLHGLTLPY